MEQTVSAPASAKKKKNGQKPHGRGARIVRALIALVVLAALVAGVLWYLRQRGAAAGAAEVQYETAAAVKGAVTTKLSGSGTLEPADAYSVTTLVQGEVLTAAFEEGDAVTTDTVLYTIDSSDESTSLEKTQLSLDQAQSAYDKALDSLSKLTVSCEDGGTVVSLAVEVGDEVTAGQAVATVRDSAVMKLTLPFASADAAGFSVGSAATVTLDGSFETLPGTVSGISAVEEVTAAGQLTRQVTLEVANPGALGTARLATARVGDAFSAGSGSFAYRSEETVCAGTSGTVASVLAAEGERVSGGTALLRLTSDQLQDSVDNAYQSLRNAQLSYESQTDTLDNYTIMSPIEGTIIDKYYKAGDKVSSGREMCLIYDLSHLTFSLSVDELDVSQVAVGQTAVITADAVEGRTYEGVVTKVSVAGTTSGGVTTYPVTIRIDEAEGLLPGMNVDVEIVVDSVSDVIVIPNQAVVRGSMVLVTSDSPSAVNALDAEAPEGYVYVAVTTGLSDDSSVAVLSGLQEGDTVASVAVTAESGTNPYGAFGSFGGMQGGTTGGRPGGEFGGMQGGGAQGGFGGGPGGN